MVSSNYVDPVQTVFEKLSVHDPHCLQVFILPPTKDRLPCLNTQLHLTCYIIKRICKILEKMSDFLIRFDLKNNVHFNKLPVS